MFAGFTEIACCSTYLLSSESYIHWLLFSVCRVCSSVYIRLYIPFHMTVSIFVHRQVNACTEPYRQAKKKKTEQDWILCRTTLLDDIQVAFSFSPLVFWQLTGWSDAPQNEANMRRQGLQTITYINLKMTSHRLLPKSIDCDKQEEKANKKIKINQTSRSKTWCAGNNHPQQRLHGSTLIF